MMSTSVNTNKRALDRLKRRGSLPLKKRRVTLHQGSSPEELKSTFLPLDTKDRKKIFSASDEELKPVTPEPLSAVVVAGCLSVTHSGFCNKPCFKQSSYCKMHFLQRGEGSSSSVGGGSGGDKRYTGAKNQVRCSATTTRGRPCAYIAVGESLKYCHLHSDYDTNPPPRRDSRRPGIHDSTSSLTSTGSSTSSSNSRASPTSSNVSLLSNLPTDKWKHQSVRIALGPLTGRTGVVEKWGNGWVSCNVDGVGLHNRRAFELHLIGNKKEPPPPMTPNSTEGNSIKQVTPCSVADVSSIQVPEIRLPNEDSSNALSFRLSERASGSFRNPL